MKKIGYPKPLMKRVLSKTPTKPAEDVSMDDDTTCTEETKLLCLPYVKGMSEQIERGCQQLGVRVVFRSGNKLRQ